MTKTTDADPAHPAIVTDDGTVTYATLVDAAERLSGAYGELLATASR